MNASLPSLDAERVCRLFDTAAELEPEARTAYLRRACAGDPALRREVESLLSAYARVDDVLAPYESFVGRSSDRHPDPLDATGSADPLLGRQVSHYQILEKLGGGGMGIVYNARDVKLDRLVALKFLPLEVTLGAEARKRFIHEARAASMLDHPHISVVYEIGETAEGQLFIAMAFYDGESLKQMIAKGALPVEEAVEYAIQTGKGLARAHEAGIVHRDVKPANLMVTDRGEVKIVDFGLAKIADVSLTKTGATMGTAAYMSPEQARGKEVDERSDLWSLGVVLYEMLTGERPFKGAHEQAVVYAILNEEPEPVGALRPEAPEALEGVVGKLLKKDPGERYQRAEELLADLHSIQSGRGVVQAHVAPAPKRRPRRARAVFAGGAALLLVLLVAVGRVLLSGGGLPVESIAVLPLANLSGDPEQEYFADGMHDALIGELARIGALRVISRTSVMQYKDSDKSIPEIARELNVDAVVEAALFRADDSVRIQVQLIQAFPNERHLWAQTYDRDVRDVPALNSDVAQAIARQVDVKLTPEEETRLASTRRVDPEAQEAYFKGRFHLEKLSPEHYEIALQYLEQALEIDPDYVLAYTAVTRAWAARSLWGNVPPREAIRKAREAASRALALDNSLAEAHEWLAVIYYCYEWDWDAAQASFDKAIELDPNRASVRLFYGDFLLSMRRSADAMAQMKLAVELDPLNTFSHVMLGWALLASRRYEEAIAELQKALKMDPTSPLALRCLWTAFHHQGRYEEALAEAQKFYRAQGLPETAEVLARGQAEGDHAAAYRNAAERLATQALQDYVPAERIARLYAHAGDRESALDWLEKAYEERHPSMFSINVDPHWDVLREHPRFQALLDQMQLEG